MFTLLSNVSSSIYNYVFRKEDKYENEIEKVILQLDEATNKYAGASKSDQMKLDINQEGCFYANGIITAITDSYVIIDNNYYCDKCDIVPNNIQNGAKVKYLAYQIDENKEIKVSKVVSTLDDWNVEQEEEVIDSMVENFIPEVEKQQIMTKRIVRRVEHRDKRQVNAGEISINLNNISSEFVPLVGDWISITALMAVDTNAADLTGELLSVKSIKPLRSKLITGKVTNYDAINKTGSIDKQVIFHSGAIGGGYIPCVGDIVICDSIESEQQMFTWRALSVVPVNKSTIKYDSTNRFHGFQLPNNINELEQNKNGIIIDNNLEVELEINEEKLLKVQIENTSHISQVILNCSFATNKDKSQIILYKPEFNSKVILNSKETVTYVFKCTAKYIGRSVEIVQFHFNHFQIARIFSINVKAKKTLNYRAITKKNIEFNAHIMLKQEINDTETCIPGIRPFKSAPFAVPTGVFKVPQIYWDTILHVLNSKYSEREAEVELSNAIPSLSQKLTFLTYKKHFHGLLYLEEVAQRTNIQMYNIESAILRPSGEYLVMDVPGLSEKRPSLIVGDKVIIQYKWDASNGNKKYEGFIHKIKNIEIFLKFNQQFHEIYHNEDCKVSFEASVSVIQRCHRAINIAVTNLGERFLFPANVIEKEPQYILEEIDNREENQKEENPFSEINNLYILQKDSNDINVNNKIETCCKKILKKRKLEWFNKYLNKYQKEAVKNILIGIARPLPYIIFGPPGTGKTITLCETIMQIFTLIPDSRILVASPSNSSANLITERLLDFNILKPGDLIRLVANYYINGDAIPEKLLPFCATADLTSPNSTETSNNDSRKSYNSTIIGRHRITIGTCAALGILHNLGFKPGHFTHVLVDEAGQATEPEIMIPISFIQVNSGQVVLAGDPLQLGPVIISKFSIFFGFAQSFLERLLQQFPYQRDNEGFECGYDPRLITKLLINYRSLPEILELPNKLFYNSELIPFVSPRNSKEMHILEMMKEDLPHRKHSPPAIVFHGVNGMNLQDYDSPSWYNLEEATQIYLYFLRLCEKGFTADDIGIITPYKKQVYEIRNMLCNLDVDVPKIGTVEEFQGQERNIIMLSTVRSVSEIIADDVKFSLGFVSAPQRLNVAITRARALLIIIGNPYLLSYDSYWRSVLEYCINQNSYTGSNMQCSLNQPTIEVSQEVLINNFV